MNFGPDESADDACEFNLGPDDFAEDEEDEDDTTVWSASDDQVSDEE